MGNDLRAPDRRWKFLYTRTLKQTWFDQEVIKPKVRRKLPMVWSREEICALARCRDQQQAPRTARPVITAPGCAVRKRLDLKVTDIDSKRMIINIREGKGKFPRQVMLSPKLLELLRLYWRGRKPRECWLFPGERPDGPLFSRTRCELPARSCARNLGISRKPLEPACAAPPLRHPYLLDAGTDLRSIQLLLGHRDLETTARYPAPSLKPDCMPRRARSTTCPFASIELRKGRNRTA